MTGDDLLLALSLTCFALTMALIFITAYRAGRRERRRR